MMMLADIRRQPEVLAGLSKRRSEFAEAAQQWLRPVEGGRVYVIGCGDGWFAARSVARHPRSSLEFLSETAPSLGSVDRVIAISMSGNVDRTVEAASAARDHGVPVVALVNGKGGRLADLASAKLSLDVPDLAPFLCGTASYTATVLALQMLLGLDESEGLAEAAASVLAKAEEMAAATVHDNPEVDGVRFLSCGRLMATVDYGAAKLVELTKTPSWSDDIEEFAHRQYWTMSFHNTVWYLAPESNSAECATHAATALAKAGVKTAAIEQARAAVPTAHQRLMLPEGPAAQAPILAAIPLQLYAYRLAEATGFDPNRRLHLKNDELRFTVSRMLTRRSLLGTGQ